MESGLLLCGIFDESGSMSSHLDRHIEGINAFVADQKGAATSSDDALIKFNCLMFNHKLRWQLGEGGGGGGGNFVTTATFPDIKEFVPFTRLTYVPDGTTALFDAIGTAIKSIDNFIATHATRSWNVAVVIQTDGVENASSMFTQTQIREMIAERSTAGWNFTYLGADQDAISAASHIGIDRNAAVSYITSETDLPRLMTNVSRTVTQSCTKYADRSSTDMSTLSTAAVPATAEAKSSADQALVTPVFPMPLTSPSLRR